MAQVLGMVGLAIEDDPKFANQQILIDSGMRALEQIGTKSEVSATDLEMLPLLNAVVAADKVVPRLDVLRLHNANLKLRALAML